MEERAPKRRPRRRPSSITPLSPARHLYWAEAAMHRSGAQVPAPSRRRERAQRRSTARDGRPLRLQSMLWLRRGRCVQLLPSGRLLQIHLLEQVVCLAIYSRGTYQALLEFQMQQGRK
ncbi:uncharacterized protein LOC119310581 [Triticum dicoccoides]|uniref:uncharacterized protein LOC119310581 n=1 Tax=Triticum dicoccoides TaxID=85692 RepID=UPI001891F2E0|nr:uncharacterized protein LOC119310581 [Triticum dicoccoides]